MKITIEGDNITVEPASELRDIIRALLCATAGVIAPHLKNGVDKVMVAEQFGKKLEELIVAYDSGKAAASHVVQ